MNPTCLSFVPRPQPERRHPAGLLRILRNLDALLINTAASARCRSAHWAGKLFQQFAATNEKPLKRLMRRGGRVHRAEAAVLMRSTVSRQDARAPVQHAPARWSRYLLPILCAAAVTGCEKQKPAPRPTPKVTVDHPRFATVTNWDEYPGHLEAVEMVDIRPRVSGYIDSIHFKDGAEVNAGDLLFVIDPRPYQADLDQAEARRKQAETHLELAQNDLKRADDLKGSKAISAEEYDTRHNAVRAAEAALAAAKASEATARLNLDYTRLKAPVSGKIGRRLLTVGNFVQLQGNSGSANTLATLVSVDPIYAYFDVEEAAYAKYRSEAKAAQAEGRELPCELALFDESGFTHRGRLDFFDNQVNSKTGTIRLRAVFDNHDRTLVPGMFGNLRILSGKPVQALLVPDVAVQSDQGYKFVYTVDGEGKVDTRYIDAGRAHGPMREVLKGLTPDDRVVVNGLMLLRPKLKVEAQEAKPETEGAKNATEQPAKPAAKPQT